MRPKKSKSETISVEIISDQASVGPFVGTVQKSADREKRSLGFLPKSVYESAAQRGSLLVAVVETRGQKEFGGYLLFGGTFPHARVFQVFVRSTFRRKGIARMLVEHFIEDNEKNGYLSISARVADDLEANHFWGRMGFDVVRTIPGDGPRKRQIHIRIRELDTASLFRPAASGGSEDLGLVERFGSRIAVYAIDLNVFWDVVKNRVRSEYGIQVISAGFHGLVQVVVTREFINELRRSCTPGREDPVVEFALQLPTLPEPDAEALNALLDELGGLIFSGGKAGELLSAQDRSDLVHLATAIHHGASGFVTCDDRLTKTHEAIYQRYGVRVVHVAEFAAGLRSIKAPAPSAHAHLASETLRTSELGAGEIHDVTICLDLLNAPTAFREDFLGRSAMNSARKQLAVFLGTEVVCLGSWDAGAGVYERAHMRVIANEEHPAVETALEFMIAAICSTASRLAPVLLELELAPGQVVCKKVALLRGFRPTRSPMRRDAYLQKVCVGRPIGAANWAKVRANLRHSFDLHFPEDLPNFTAYDQPISFSGADRMERLASLNSLETLLSPTLFILPGRTGAVVPIRRAFAEELLGTARQLSFNPRREALLLSERVYFSSPRTSGTLKKGVVVFFYESARGGGDSAIVAVARIAETALVLKSDVPARLLRRGVVEVSEIEGFTATDSVAATTFDNVMILKAPVSLRRLRVLNIADRANFVTARGITYEQVCTILEEGNVLD